jgi:hypothetical protein
MPAGDLACDHSLEPGHEREVEVSRHPHDDTVRGEALRGHRRLPHLRGRSSWHADRLPTVEGKVNTYL